MQAQFDVFQSKKNNRWYWTLIAPNGEPILKTAQADGFDKPNNAKDECIDTAKAVITQKAGKQTIERFDSAGGKPMFRVVSTDGDKLGVSEEYETPGGRAKGIDAVLEHAPQAEIVIAHEPR